MPERVNPTDSQKAEILRIYGMQCFIDGHPIQSEDDLEFDHMCLSRPGELRRSRIGTCLSKT